ncbi:beta strand repeat-containing protein [Winogradskyella aurantia]|uniref:beta strand repeat-containing protein n=1 Tax=Winogradskyella aurantia TaxID=1915063 RepID=UPI00197FB49F|nr:hypothetical protein [Winogradskyella aurantia]
MKTININFIFTMILSLAILSCNNDDDGGGGPPSQGLDGIITADLTLDPNITYNLSGDVRVADGVTLTIPAGTEIVSAVGTGNYLAVLQGGMIDIQGTPSNPVVMRSSSGNAGSWGGLLLCGNAPTTAGTNVTAEVGGLVYGGTNASDDSGSINYLIIRDAGAQINADSQYNGLSLYAVGSGTSITNVAIINGADDGVEFFGGTVNASNIYLENNEDDAVDWTEGWNGTLSDTYVVNTIQGFSTAIEADGTASNPTIENFTAISSTGGLAIQMKAASTATINGFTATGFDLLFEFAGTSTAAELLIDGAAADTAEDAVYASSPTNASDFAWATDAFDSNQLPGNITADVTLNPSVEYTISGPVLVNSGVTLTIPAGTQIVSESGTANYLAVLQGGSIEIEGTIDNPVEMRSVDGNPWGGLLVCGNASTTAGTNVTAEVGGLVYGGNNDTESSGSIDYLILRNTGAQINADSQFNGLSLYAVGSGTSISNVAVISGADDGIEFFGGTVSVTNFYAENIEDDAIDWTEGWNGTMNTAYIVNTIQGFSTAIEADGTASNPTLNNLTAISSTGGLAIQMKAASTATINGFTATGFDLLFEFAGTSTPAELVIDGAAADTANDAVYSSSPTNASNFAWATGDLVSDQLPANITSNLTLDPSVIYTISGPVLVNSGATLTIPAGTEIVSASGTANYLAVLQGGSIDIQGSMMNPVEMRSDDGNPWGGLLICGNSTTTAGENVTAEVGGLVYGGNSPTESSGNIDYLILRNTGAQINADSQFNGLSLYAVGSGTTIDNVAVIDGADDGIEFFGGTVSVTNFYAENIEDDSVDWTEGWNGTLANTFVKQTITGFSTSIEADGTASNPTLTNFTAISSTGGLAIQMKAASTATINGLTLTGYALQFEFAGTSTAAELVIDGAAANEATTYDSSTTLEADFGWIDN